MPSKNKLYTKYELSFKNVTLSALIRELDNSIICQGVSYKTEHILTHTVPRKYVCGESPMKTTIFNRPKECLVLCEAGKCSVCQLKGQQHNHYLKRKEITLQEPAKLNAPGSLTSSKRLLLTVQNYRIENKELKSQVARLQEELKNSSVSTSTALDNDLVSIMSSADQSKVSPFMKFFWEQQQHYIKTSSTGVRYHPAIIRYCLSLHAKSSSAYEDIRYNEKTGTGFLILPSQRRLRDYRNYIRSQRGFNKGIIAELLKKTEDFSDGEKYMVLLLDEMKIQENLVWDKHTGELIGYVDLGDTDVNMATFENVQTFASHVLVLMVRSIINPFKFSFATFATTGANSSQLFTIFWKAVCILELSCKLKVLAVTCDGASPNRKFFKMHSRMEDKDNRLDEDVDVTYSTANLYSTDDRLIYFIEDQPHKMKTSRNCLANSGGGKMTRLMWNNGCFLVWSRISQLFYEDMECGLQLLPRLTYDHVRLNSYSIMNVKLAAQVLSHSVGQVLTQFGPPEAAETAKFCLMMDSFFDIVNIRNKTEYITKSKPNLKPIYSPDDPRLSWLLNDFLGYFKAWKESINNRPGDYNSNDKARMFISRQTFEGLTITVHSIVNCVKFLLQNNICKYVLTERFCQDPLENYFGRQRSMGARKDNPTLRDVGYNNNTIRNQKVFRPISSGNCIDQASVEISNHAEKGSNQIEYNP